MKWLTRLFVAVLVVGLFVAVLVVGLSVLPVLANGCPRPKPVKQTIVRVCVDHTRTLTQLIEAGKYDWINQTIAQYIFKHTLESGTESVTTDIILLDFH